MKARIVNGQYWGGNHSEEWLENNQELFFAGELVSEWNLTTNLPNEGIKEPKLINNEWIESFVEIIEVPTELSRMKFIIQVFITTGIKYEDIVLFIQNLTFDEVQKYVILTRLRSATHFDRYSIDLLTIAAMMEITSEQLDSIFINGNLIE